MLGASRQWDKAVVQISNISIGPEARRRQRGCVADRGAVDTVKIPPPTPVSWAFWWCSHASLSFLTLRLVKDQYQDLIQGEWCQIQPSRADRQRITRFLCPSEGSCLTLAWEVASELGEVQWCLWGGLSEQALRYSEAGLVDKQGMSREWESSVSCFLVCSNSPTSFSSLHRSFHEDAC